MQDFVSRYDEKNKSDIYNKILPHQYLLGAALPFNCKNAISCHTGAVHIEMQPNLQVVCSIESYFSILSKFCWLKGIIIRESMLHLNDSNTLVHSHSESLTFLK